MTRFRSAHAPCFSYGVSAHLLADVYILHSADCLATGRPLTECPYSLSLGQRMSLQRWAGFLDQPVYARIIQLGELVPDGRVS